MKNPSPSIFLGVQGVFLVAFGVAWAALDQGSDQQLRRELKRPPSMPVVAIERAEPLMVAPLYDDSEVVSDQELADVLFQIRPRFAPEHRKPNHVEHALRTWRADAEFQEPGVLSGAELVEFLTDHGRYLASWEEDTKPLLVDKPAGVEIRWGKSTGAGASVHHDHWLACLTEAGVGLDHRLSTPSRRMTLEGALQQALRDFRIDERETEWSALAFGLWLPPQRSWQTSDGRVVTFDMLARRLLRGHRQYGVCRGTHRVYSLMLLVRLDDEFDILSENTRTAVISQLETVRDLITDAQFPDGRWASDWWRGADAVSDPDEAEIWETVITTGHHLEWLAIAPQELHPPREQILKAADWIIETTVAQSEEQIRDHYTFYSHVGNALALWRGTRAPDFWKGWRAEHPWKPTADELQDSDDTKDDGTAAAKVVSGG